jgi:hypothetical protein
VSGTISLEEDRYEVPLRHTTLRYVVVVARMEVLGVGEIPQAPLSVDIVIDPSLVPERSLVHELLLHFRDGRDGSPLSGVQVHAITNSRNRDGRTTMGVLNFGSPRDPPADRELELPLALCSISMECEGFVPRSITIDPSRRGAPSELTIEFLPPGGSVAVIVEDEEGHPVSEASIRTYRGSSRECEVLGRDATTDERGEYSIAQLPAGECIVVAEKEGFAPAASSVTVDGEGTPLDLVLERGFEVTLKARLADGTPGPSGLFNLEDERGLPLYDNFLPHARAVRLSSARVRLTEGTYTIRCVVLGAYEGSTTFVAAPEALVEVELQPIR